ncbi:MAG: class A beta-lactamase-related serine hydrolase [Fimbriimonadales bacterium]|nr:class A beta-lactamase-related serine hydrolase [Fimbriimonadales bacterium]
MAPNPARLKAKLDAICERFRGVMGYSLYHTRYPHRLNRMGDEIFPTASTIKTALMAKAFEEIDAGRLSYHETIPITPEDLRDGAGLLQFFREKQSVPVKMLLHLMITVSDNTATAMLARRLGTVEVNRFLERLGLKHTRLLMLHPPDDMELKALRNRWGMGMCTPNEMVELLDAIRTGRAGTPAACDRMLRILSHQFYDDLIGGSVPPWVVAATKSGAIERSRSDTGIVFSPSGAYILAVYTKEAEDTRWSPENEGEMAIREVAREVWRFYHPREKWQPPAGMERYPPA